MLTMTDPRFSLLRRIAAVSSMLCAWQQSSKWHVTCEQTLETAVAGDIYCKWIHTDAFSWILLNTATCSTDIKYLVLLVKSNIFVTILNTQNTRETNVNLYWVLFHFFCAQHVSDINTSIIRSLRLFYCIITFVIQ